MNYHYDSTGERIEDDEPADVWEPTQPDPGRALAHAYREYLEPRTEQGRREGVAACREALADARRRRGPAS